MMTHSSEEDRLDSGEMGRHRLAAPSPGLRKRVLRLARDAWAAADTVSDDVPWTLPAFRLAASVVAAALLICFASIMDRHSVAQWQPSGQPSGQAVAAASAYSASRNRPELAKFAAAAAALPDKNASKGVLLRLQQAREMLNTTGDANG